MTAGRPLMPRSNEGSGAPGAQQEMAKVPDGANPTGKKGHVAAVAAGYKENSPQIVAAMRPGLFMPQQPKQARLGVKILKAPEEAQQSNTQESGDTESNDNREQSCSENPVPEKDKDKVNSHAPGSKCTATGPIECTPSAMLSTEYSMRKAQAAAAQLLASWHKHVPKCSASEDMLLQVQGLLAVADEKISIGIAGPDAYTAASTILKNSLTLPDGVQTHQSRHVADLPQPSDVIVILVDASLPCDTLDTHRNGDPRRKEGSIGGRSLETVTTTGQVGALIQRASRKVGSNNVFLGLAGCGAEAAGLPSDCSKTEQEVASGIGLQQNQVACFSLPGGSLFGGGAGGGTVGGRKRLLTWCSHIASAARDVQAQRAKQLESLLAPARNVLSFWEGLYAISSPSSWILRRLLVAAIEGVPTLQLCGCETVASGYLDSSGAHVGSPDISTLVKTQGSVTYTMSFLSGIRGIFSAPIGLPVTVAADLLVRIRLCLAIACVGGYKSIDPNTIAAALCCLDRTVDGRVEAGKHALNPELQQVESPISDGQGVADGNEDLCWTDAARLAAGMAAERARRSALESGASNAEADELASAEYKAQLPLDLATGALTVILHSRGDWLDQAIQVVPFMAGVVSGEVHGAATQEVGAAAMEVFLHHVPLPGC